jgi:hypothetical protein
MKLPVELAELELVAADEVLEVEPTQPLGYEPTLLMLRSLSPATQKVANRAESPIEAPSKTAEPSPTSDHGLLCAIAGWIVLGAGLIVVHVHTAFGISMLVSAAGLIASGLRAQELERLRELNRLEARLRADSSAITSQATP